VADTCLCVFDKDTSSIFRFLPTQLLPASLFDMPKGSQPNKKAGKQPAAASQVPRTSTRPSNKTPKMQEYRSSFSSTTGRWLVSDVLSFQVQKQQDDEDRIYAKYVHLGQVQKQKDREHEGDDLDQQYARRRVSSFHPLSMITQLT
jgi:hypothetical protein